MSSQKINSPTKEGEVRLPVWMHETHLRLGLALAGMHQARRAQTNRDPDATMWARLSQVTMRMDKEWVHQLLRDLSAEELGDTLEIPTHWEDNDNETTGEYLIGLLTFYSKNLKPISGILEILG